MLFLFLKLNCSQDFKAGKLSAKTLVPIIVPNKNKFNVPCHAEVETADNLISCQLGYQSGYDILK